MGRQVASQIERMVWHIYASVHGTVVNEPVADYALSTDSVESAGSRTVIVRA